MPANQQTNIVQPYLFYGGRCEDALNFYRNAIGAEIQAMLKYSENPDPATTPPGFDTKVMHAAFRVGGSTILASDGHREGTTFQGFSLCYVVATPEEADKAFGALSRGGHATMPLTETFYSPRFGMLTDKFGIAWMVMAIKPMHN